MVDANGRVTMDLQELIRAINEIIDKDKSSYYVLADPKEAEHIKRTKDDKKAIFRGTAKDAQSFAKSKMKSTGGKSALVLMKRNPKGEYEYAVGEGTTKEVLHMSRAKKLIGELKEMYALGADMIVNWFKKAAYERFKIDPSTISVVPWPGDGSDFHIQSPLTEQQWSELQEIITRTYPLYVTEHLDGTTKFFSSRTVGTPPENTDVSYPREEAPQQ